MINIEDLKYASLPVQYDIDPLFDDERFIKMRARIQHDDLNLNGSVFEKEDMERARHSLVNIPILANVIFDDDGNPQFGSHDIILEKDKLKENEYREIYKEVPIGLIPETSNYEIKEYDGKNFVYTDIYLWRGYMNYGEDVVLRDKDIKLSMEISISKFTYDNNKKTYQILDYKYTGITFLGNDHQPAMQNALATIEPNDDFNLEKFAISNKENMLQMMSELQDALQNYNSSNNDVNINNTLSNIEGGNKNLDEKLKILTEFNLKQEDLSFSIDELSVEDLKIKLEEFTKQEAENKFYTTNTFAVTANQKREALRNALSPIYESNGNGDIIAMTDFWLMDWDDNFAYVDKDRYSDVDYTSDFGRIAYTFNESNFKATITGEFEKMVKVYMRPEDYNAQKENLALLKYTEEDVAKIQKEFEDYKAEYTTKDSDVQEFEALKEYKAQKELEEFNEAKDALFAQFEDLKDDKEFEDLKSNAEFTLDDFEKELFCLRGKKLTTNFTAIKKKNKTEQKAQFTKIPLMQSEVNVNDKPYGDLYERYSD